MTIEEILSMSKEDLNLLDTDTLEEMKSLLEDASKHDHVTQHSLKILINSLYGALANKNFLMANPDMAAGITASGRFFVQLMANAIEDGLQALLKCEGPYVHYGDTDSVYYSIKPFVEKKFGKDAKASTEILDWCDNFEKKIIQPLIQKAIDEYAEILNVFDKTQIGVEREIIADSAAFVAKKKYFARVLDSEGVRFSLDDPYIKVMGLEIARSSTPKWVKEKLGESIGVILDTDANGVRKWRDAVKLEFANQPLEDICMIQGISSFDYNLNDKGIPQGSRSGIAHNNWVKQNGLEAEIELLTPGEKYKRCYLLTPNRFGTEILSFADSKISKIIEEDGIFDFAKNFEKQFESTLERMVEGIGYDIKDKPIFDDLDAW